MSQTIRIVILVDNVAKEGFQAEYGFALWIEVDGIRVLLDTGQSGALQINAQKAGIDLTQVDKVVLSHGHYDHAGVLDQLMEMAPHFQLYLHPGALRHRYSYRQETLKPIHIPDPIRASIERWPASQTVEVNAPMALSEHLTVTGEIPRITPYEDVGGPFFLDKAVTQPDPLEDDQALCIDTREGWVIGVGCSHAGVINTVNAIRALHPEKPVRALIGGFHLMEASEERIEATLDALEAFDIPLIVPCHCTGASVMKRMEKRLGNRVMLGAAGTELFFPQ
jgi:7,8-dihydropterin-6-yl-methyl-4-(beta-D-ribofuranosyl)aminobenzene 5'-phosphate synthase